MQQDCILFEISSITLAQKAKSILKGCGFGVQILRGSTGLDGCGYHLQVTGDPARARVLLKEKKIPVHGTLPCETA